MYCLEANLNDISKSGLINNKLMIILQLLLLITILIIIIAIATVRELVLVML